MPNASQLSAKCLDIYGCPSYGKSFSALGSVNSMIGNVTSNIGILTLVGANDSQTPLEQALLLQQRLTEVNHPDHIIIVYPGLGHTFVPSNRWITSHGQIEEYVFQDIYEWLTSPARGQRMKRYGKEIDLESEDINYTEYSVRIIEGIS